MRWYHYFLKQYTTIKKSQPLLLNVGAADVGAASLSLIEEEILAARRNRTQEVGGSNPLVSTMSCAGLAALPHGIASARMISERTFCPEGD